MKDDDGCIIIIIIDSSKTISTHGHSTQGKDEEKKELTSNLLSAKELCAIYNLCVYRHSLSFVIEKPEILRRQTKRCYYYIRHRSLTLALVMYCRRPIYIYIALIWWRCRSDLSLNMGVEPIWASTLYSYNIYVAYLLNVFMHNILYIFLSTQLSKSCLFLFLFFLVKFETFRIYISAYKYNRFMYKFTAHSHPNCICLRIDLHISKEWSNALIIMMGL